jgi:alpha-tubulin suppressor-like RCC1 family protein
VTGLADVIAISRSEISACALLSGGAVECWGYNADGELGDGTSTGPQVCTVLGNSYPCSMTPVPVLGLNGAESISQGGANGCASLSGGVVECWGDNEVGELGIGTNTGPQTCGVAQEADPCSTTPVSVVW